jgi:hypothetical protein
MWAVKSNMSGTANWIASAKSSPRFQIERAGPLYQLAGNGDCHRSMTLPVELYPRTSIALLGVVKHGLVESGPDNPLLRI